MLVLSLVTDVPKIMFFLLFFFFLTYETPFHTQHNYCNGQWFRAMCWVLIGLQNDQIQINLKKKKLYIL